VIPLLLIILASIASYPTQPLGTGRHITIITFIGSPVLALLIGAILSFALPKKLDKKMLSTSGWIGEALLIAAPVIFIPAQGSTTVAMITTASIIAPLLGPLGLDSETMKVLTALSVGAGAIAISHANDSGFWVVTQLSGMTIKQGNQSHSLGTLIMGVTAIGIIYVISLVVG
jgi:GntP family gluconate:H+ symporter